MHVKGWPKVFMENEKFIGTGIYSNTALNFLKVFSIKFYAYNVIKLSPTGEIVFAIMKPVDIKKYVISLLNRINDIYFANFSYFDLNGISFKQCGIILKEIALRNQIPERFWPAIADIETDKYPEEYKKVKGENKFSPLSSEILEALESEREEKIKIALKPVVMTGNHLNAWFFRNAPTEMLESNPLFKNRNEFIEELKSIDEMIKAVWIQEGYSV